MRWDNEKEIKVLLVEDDEDDYIITRDFLSEVSLLNFKLYWEPDYANALQKMLRQEYHLYLIDYRLGEYNGIELLKEARSNNITDPIILLTGQGDREVDLMAMREGASDYLVKENIDANVLSRSLRYALNTAWAVQELNEKERRYRSLFTKSIDAIFITNKEMSFIDVNSSMIKLLGYSKEDMLQMKLKNLFVEETDFSDFNDELVRYGRTSDYEVMLRNVRGRAIECIINSTALEDTEGQVIGYQGIIHDISVRKRAEEELILAEKFSMTGKIARSIAHEVRNPLTNLNLALEQLKDEISEENDMVELYADIIKRNADRIEQLISEMLNSSKPKQLKLKEEDLNKIVEETLQLTLDRLNLKKMKLKRNYNELPPIMLDADKFKMALLNILINAVEAMEEGEGLLEVATTADNGEIILSIKDNGKGIAKDDVGKLFDPFFTGKKGGMGLGLTTTQNIINSHKGKIEVESIAGVGTEFIISFRKEWQAAELNKL